MSTSDQRGPLTRKQLREIRLTGSTPIISEEQANAAAESAPPAPVAPLPRAAEPVVVPPAPVADASVDLGAAPLTRRQAREQEKIKTASVPVVGGEAAEIPEEAMPDAAATDTADEPAAVESPDDIVSGIPDFAPAARTQDDEDAVDEDAVDEDATIAPVRASGVVESGGEVPLAPEAERPQHSDDEVTADAEPADDLLAKESEDDVEEGDRPTVSPSFGEGVLQEEAPAERASFRASFDELLTSNDSGGTQHSAPNALIFTPSPGEGSLSGPVASTGEILVTGSYELPKGLGSQGHAHGTTDGKEVDAVLIDGELPPASSPTPIAASSAVSTIKPAGEVIRPPAPEKGNRLMLVAAIIAGALALGLGTALVFAITGNVF